MRPAYSVVDRIIIRRAYKLNKKYKAILVHCWTWRLHPVFDFLHPILILFCYCFKCKGLKTYLKELKQKRLWSNLKMMFFTSNLVVSQGSFHTYHEIGMMNSLCWKHLCQHGAVKSVIFMCLHRSYSWWHQLYLVVTLSLSKIFGQKCIYLLLFFI